VRLGTQGPHRHPHRQGLPQHQCGSLRQRFSTYANLRPVHTLPGVPTRFDNVDLVIVRENTEDLYKGIEYMLNDEIANGVKLITRPACEKICRFAFDYARKNGRKKVTAVHKANIMKLTDGLFLRTFREVAAEYPPMLALGAKPRPPTRPAHRALIKSP